MESWPWREEAASAKPQCTGCEAPSLSPPALQSSAGVPHWLNPTRSQRAAEPGAQSRVMERGEWIWGAHGEYPVGTEPCPPQRFGLTQSWGGGDPATWQGKDESSERTSHQVVWYNERDFKRKVRTGTHETHSVVCPR